jgi:hypothetical protein
MNWIVRAIGRQKLRRNRKVQLKDEKGVLNHCSGELGLCSCVIRMAVGWNWFRFTLLCHGIFLVEIFQLTHLKA